MEKQVKIIISKLLKEIGFTHISAHCLDILVNLLERRFFMLAYAAQQQSGECNRTFLALFDLIEWNTSYLPNHGSITFMKDPIDPSLYVKTTTEKLNVAPPEKLPNYCFTHMPPYPSQHSFKQTPRINENARELRLRSANQSRQLQQNLKRLIQKCTHTNVNALDPKEDEVSPLSFPLIHS